MQHSTSARKSRRRFIRGLAATGVAASAARGSLPGSEALAQTAPGVRGFDHVAAPLQNVDAMVAFYKAVGMQVNQTAQLVSVHFGDHKINFHLPVLWQRESFTLRAPAARPPCGDFCFVWDGGQAALSATLERAGAKVVEGPATRAGGRRGGLDSGMSTYVRDPDGNLLEFIIYA